MPPEQLQLLHGLAPALYRDWAGPPGSRQRFSRWGSFPTAVLWPLTALWSVDELARASLASVATGFVSAGLLVLITYAVGCIPAARAGVLCWFYLAGHSQPSGRRACAAGAVIGALVGAVAGWIAAPAPYMAAEVPPLLRVMQNCAIFAIPVLAGGAFSGWRVSHLLVRCA